MNWSSLDVIVLWLGHFLIGFIYYLQYYLLLTKEEMNTLTENAIKKRPEVEEIAPLMKNKALVASIYLIVGYFNLLLSAKKLLVKWMKK